MRKQISRPKLSLLMSAIFLSSSSQAIALDYEVNDTKISIYGYAKLDIMYDSGDIKSGNSNGMGDSVNFRKIAVDGQSNSSGHTNLNAGESRIGFRTATSTDKGDLITTIEGDFFFGDFRLRQAYGSWNGITAGQTWSNFHTFISTTPTLDFTGPAGRDSFLRQAQLRYSFGDFHVALEDPGGAMSGESFDGGYDADYQGDTIAGTDVGRKDSLPDLTLRYEESSGDLKWSTAALMREVAFDSGGDEDSTIGWGLFVAGSYSLSPSTTLRGQITGGDGIGDYMKVNPAPAAYRVANQLETIPAWGGTLGISQEIGPGSLNVSYSRVEADWDDAERDGVSLVNTDNSGEFIDAYDDNYDLIHVNYLWNPTKNVTYGVELSHAMRETVDGRDGNVNRAQASIIYDF
ncbi:DcaP family trimeric outer membrane transporter [Halomonas kalidii]|uniref:DcaP family trimeric outer membrane transporter n=1 Tax=Halomonas kalidii TaxID=3043293 RepID=A0ABT6VP43_9GAMM|nr:DcaP family trimeric outer membrane transporter [Halomonas kalidii]MDI5935425.1 DcaP family trimeric outer membrane transporter [Halomonas kalidii]